MKCDQMALSSFYTQEQHCDSSAVDVKQERDAPSSNSCTRASQAQLEQQRVEVGFGLINFNKLDDAISASSISSSSFCKRNELQISQTPLYEADYITTNGSEKQK
jgi:hypothetical protein